jgi:hypothetical protein
VLLLIGSMAARIARRYAPPMTQGFYEQLGADPQASLEELRAAYTRVVAHLLRRKAAIVDQGGDISAIELSRVQADEAFVVLADPLKRRKYDAMLAISRQGVPDDLDAFWARVGSSTVHPATAAAAELLRVCTNLAVGSLPPAPRLGPPPRLKASARAEVTANGKTNPDIAPAALPSSAIAPLDADSPPAPAPRAAAAPPRQYTMADIGLPDWAPAGVQIPGATAASAQAAAQAFAQPFTPPATSAAAWAGLPAFPGGHQPPTAPGAPSSPGVPRAPLPPSPKPAARAVSNEDIARLVDQLGYSGGLLRSVREARGFTLQQVSDTTRIAPRYLEAIERDDAQGLPSATFVRGYVREMARFLGLDDNAVVQGYMRRLQLDGG